MKDTIMELTTCCACGGTHLTKVLDLGSQPLANSYKETAAEVQAEYPLAANVCGDCYHVQLTHAVNPDLLFKHYLYVSGTTKTLHDNMTWFANWVREYTGLGQGSVLDIGCNDGTQLDKFKELGWTTMGIDPAENIVPQAQAKGHAVICDYFDNHTVEQTQAMRPDVVVAQNVAAHNYDVLNFIRNVKHTLTDNGWFFMQISQADMVRNNEFDTLYHEHINFFNVRSLREIGLRAGLNLVDVIRQPIHGTSYIVVFRKNANRPFHINNLIAVDQAAGLFDMATYTEWGRMALTTKSMVNMIIATHREKGYKLVGYGAAAKGMTMINYCNMDLDFIIDDNPLKQNHFTPGKSSIPIVAITELNKYENEKIMFVPLAWNFFDEIRKRLQAVRKSEQDVFLKYFPEVQVI